MLVNDIHLFEMAFTLHRILQLNFELDYAFLRYLSPGGQHENLIKTTMNISHTHETW
jgi:hypothetical protein